MDDAIASARGTTIKYVDISGSTLQSGISASTYPNFLMCVIVSGYGSTQLYTPKRSNGDWSVSGCDTSATYRVYYY